MKRTSRACWLSAVALAAPVATTSAHAATPDYCSSAALRVELQGESGMTGGAVVFGFSVTNRGKIACRLDGVPLVRVPASAYPVVVGTLSPDFTRVGKPAPFDLSPGERATASILVARPCVGDKWMMTNGVVAIGFGGHWAALHISACKKEGSVIEVGRFVRPA